MADKNKKTSSDHYIAAGPGLLNKDQSKTNSDTPAKHCQAPKWRGKNTQKAKPVFATLDAAFGRARGQ